MEWKRRNEEDMQDTLVLEESMILKLPLVYFAILLQGAFQQDKFKQPHCRDTQRPNIMNYLVTPKATYHLLLATLPYLSEQYNHCGKNFSRISSLVVNGASPPLKILQDR